MASANNTYAMDIKSLSMKSRERLIRQFLPDIETSQAKLGYLYKVRPFNYNSEHFNTIEIRRRPTVSTRLWHDSKVVMKSGVKAANETVPRPFWVMKPLQFSEKTCVNPNEEYTVYTKFYSWRYREPGKGRRSALSHKSTARCVVTIGDDLSRTFQESRETSGLKRTRSVQTS